MAFSDNPLIIGHRGAAGLAPENTLPSFRAAYAAGVGAVELDVYQVAGELLVFHDDRLERTTNGRGALTDLPLEALRALDAGGGARIPLLREVLVELPAGIGVNIELKGPQTAGAVAELCAVEQALDVVVSSFDHAELAQFHSAAPATPVAPLFHEWQPDAVAVAERFRAFSVHLNYRITTAARVAQLTAAGFRVFCYTVNRAASARRLQKLGVSGFFTDRPDRINRAVLGG